MTSLEELSEALRSAWSSETSADEGWSVENPALGQCAVTALVVQDHFGGVLIRTMVAGVSHYFNQLDDGTEVDLTREQFAGWTPVGFEERTREYVLGYPATRERYELLVSALADRLGL